jgi:hypothetical protein
MRKPLIKDTDLLKVSMQAWDKQDCGRNDEPSRVMKNG